MIQPLLRWKRRLRVTATSYSGRSRKALQFPLKTPGRVAILDDRFLPDRNSRVFVPDELEAMYRWAPQSVVAPLNVLLSLADLSSLRDSLVVLTEIDGERLDDYREMLWQVFGVPIFEQLCGRDGTVIARECEVHDGLHIDPSAKLPEEMMASMITDHCECGLETPRLRGYVDAGAKANAASAA